MERRHQEDWILDEKYIESGDMIGILRFDGLDPLIMLGTGSRMGHCVMALWFEEKGK